MTKRSKTHRLYVVPSFTTGLGSVMNLAGSYYAYNSSDSSEQANFEAIWSDWSMVGEDICTVAEGNTKMTKKDGR